AVIVHPPLDGVVKLIRKDAFYEEMIERLPAHDRAFNLGQHVALVALKTVVAIGDELRIVEPEKLLHPFDSSHGLTPLSSSSKSPARRRSLCSIENLAS